MSLEIHGVPLILLAVVCDPDFSRAAFNDLSHFQHRVPTPGAGDLNTVHVSLAVTYFGMFSLPLPTLFSLPMSAYMNLCLSLLCVL